MGSGSRVTSEADAHCQNDSVGAFRGAQLGGRKRNFNGEKLWARGYAISTVGFEEKQIRKYIRHQGITSTVRTTACSNE